MSNGLPSLDYFLCWISYVLPLLFVWLRFESRLSRLEGRFDQYSNSLSKNERR